jgi:hypothetical protein
VTAARIIEAVDVFKDGHLRLPAGFQNIDSKPIRKRRQNGRKKLIKCIEEQNKNETRKWEAFLSAKRQKGIRVILLFGNNVVRVKGVRFPTAAPNYC